MIRKQQGVTLIELMISMMLGLGLVAGIGSLFVQSQKSFALQRNLSDMTDDGAFILEEIAKSVLLAGFVADGDKSQLPSGTVLGINFNEGEYIRGTASEFVYRYKKSSDSELENSICTSFGLASTINGTIITVKFYLEKETTAENKKNLYQTIKCDTNPNSQAKPLISQVEAFIFKYGIRNDDGTFYYTDAVPTTDWKKVMSIKVFVVLRSADKNLSRKAGTYDIEGVAKTPNNASENRLYKVFSKTIYLRGASQ